jgi:hypothetical protein
MVVDYYLPVNLGSNLRLGQPPYNIGKFGEKFNPDRKISIKKRLNII